MRILAVGFLVLAFLSGCGWFTSPSVVEPAELVELKNSIAPKVLWKRDVGAGSAGQRLGLAPAITADRIYVANADGEILALNAADGESIWSVKTDLPLSGGPGVGDGLVVVGTLDGDLIALAEDDGQEVWRGRASSEVLAAPGVGDGLVVAHSIDGALTGLASDTGESRWRYQHTVPVLSLRGGAAPVLIKDTAYCGLAGGKLVAIDLGNGTSRWELTIASKRGRSELERISDIDGEPLVRDGVVYVASFQGAVVAVGEISGSVLWQRELSSYAGLAADWFQLYASDDEGSVWALNAEDGTPRWRQDKLSLRRLSTPAVLGDYVVVGDYEGYLHWLNVLDGRMVARTRVGSDPISARGLRVDNSTLYVLGDGGELAAIQVPKPEPSGEQGDEQATEPAGL